MASRRASTQSLSGLRKRRRILPVFKRSSRSTKTSRVNLSKISAITLKPTGQKGFNGVALLSKQPLEDVMRRLPGDDSDEQARFIEASVSTEQGSVRFGCLYLPNGNPLGTEKFPYKLGWMDRLIVHAEKRLQEETAYILLGDFNVIPDPVDAKNPKNWLDDALYQPESRQRFRALANLGMTEAVRCLHGSAGNLHVLGLPGRCVAKEQRDPHRPHSAVSSGDRPDVGMRYRQARSRLGKAIGSRACLGSTGCVAMHHNVTLGSSTR